MVEPRQQLFKEHAALFVKAAACPADVIKIRIKGTTIFADEVGLLSDFLERSLVPCGSLLYQAEYA